eukprot:364405_1
MATLQVINQLIDKVDNDQTDEKKQDVNIGHIVSKIPSYKLNHSNCNVTMPAIGFGLYNVVQTEQVTINALKAGYRHFDGASFYKNEHVFGTVLKKNKISRNEIFITSKVWNDMQGYDKTIESFNKSLSDLDCEYIDLFLVHWPVSNKHCDTWKALEKLYRDEKCKAIGVSNYLKDDFEELLKHNESNKNFIKPSVNQLCINPLYYQKDLFSYFQNEHNIIIQAYKPLERGGHNLLKHEKILNISKKYNITPAQTCLKWGFQNKFVEVVKTKTPKRMTENINALFLKDFTSDDMEYLNSATTKENIDTWHKRYLKRKMEV